MKQVSFFNGLHVSLLGFSEFIKLIMLGFFSVSESR